MKPKTCIKSRERKLFFGGGKVVKRRWEQGNVCFILSEFQFWKFSADQHKRLPVRVWDRLRAFGLFWEHLDDEFCSVLLEPQIGAQARHRCLWYLPHQLEPGSWILSLAFCCVLLALYPAINLVPPTARGVVYSSHSWDDRVVVELRSCSLCWVLHGEICDFKGADPLLTVQTMRNHFDLVVSSCHFLCKWPPQKQLCVILQQCWFTALSQKAE